MSIYTTEEALFIDIIKYNEHSDNLVTIPTLNIPISNTYYISLYDDTNKEINKYLHYMINNDTNPFSNFECNLDFEEEQLYKIKLSESSIQEIDKNINELSIIISESKGKLTFILDINYLMEFIKKCEKNNTETHIYDFILYKLKNKINNLLILDKNSILTRDFKHSIIYDELKVYLLKNYEHDELNIKHDIQIYKPDEKMYWKIINKSDIIKIQEKTNHDIEYININDINAIQLTMELKKICFSNIFEEHLIVLNPLEKLGLFY